MRYDLRTRKGTVLLQREDGYVNALGPVDAQNRLLVDLDSQVIWLDGMTGRTLAVEDQQPAPPGPAPSGAGKLRAPFGGRWAATTAAGWPPWVDAITNAAPEAGGLVWSAAGGFNGDFDRVRRLGEELPLGSAPVDFATRRGWSLEVYGEKIVVSAEGRKAFDVRLTTDRAGAMVVDTNGRFEFTGKVSPAFHAAASCASQAAQGPATPSGDWPIEVCGAALEDPGLTVRWLEALRGGESGVNNAPPTRMKSGAKP
jgi:hypothetical protein